MERAASHNQGRCLADRADNPGSGAPGDSTFVLRALVERKNRAGAVRRHVGPDGLPRRRGGGEGARNPHAAGGKSGEVTAIRSISTSR